jgi:hypothetical protein
MLDKPRDALYKHEDSVVEHLSKSTVRGSVLGCSDDETTKWKWDLRVIEEPSILCCSFCSLLTCAAQKANLRLPLMTSVECRFEKPRTTISNDHTILKITFGIDETRRMYQAYPHGLSFSLLKESEGEYFARQKLNQFQIDLSMVRQ